MTHADSSLRLLGRSRDTEIGAAPSPSPTPIAAPRADRVPLRLVAWGATEADVDTAVRASTAASPWRAVWLFVEIERRTGHPCPIVQNEGASVATGEGPGWAYAVYPPRP